jgi:membrane-associated phospholipid phosphatase
MLNDHLAASHASRLVAGHFANAEPVVFALLMGWAWWAARRERAAVMAAALWTPAGVLAALAVNLPIEEMPTVRWTAFHGLVVHSSELREPSDHAALAAATVAGLFLVGRKFGFAACAAWALMVAALLGEGADSQDIAGGTVVGVTVTLIGFVLIEGPLRRCVARLRRTRLRTFTGAGKAS